MSEKSPKNLSRFLKNSTGFLDVYKMSEKSPKNL